MYVYIFLMLFLAFQLDVIGCLRINISQLLCL